MFLTFWLALRHNGVNFFNITTAKSGLMLVWFVHFDLEMCFAPQRRAIFHLSSGQLAPHPPEASLLFDPPEPQTIGKHTVFHDFPTFSRTWIFFLLILSLFWSSFFFSSILWLFPSLLFHLSSSVHIVGGLTCKLPSIIIIYIYIYISLSPHVCGL